MKVSFTVLFAFLEKFMSEKKAFNKKKLEL